MHAVLIRNAHENVYVRLGWPFRPVTDCETANRWICVVAFLLFDLVYLPESTGVLTNADCARTSQAQKIICERGAFFINDC